MDSADVNPYRAPDSEPADLQMASWLHSKRWMLVGWVCSIAVLAYGFIGVVANGLDLARTRSSGDLVKELRLLLLFGLGCFLCWLTWSIQKQKRTDLTRLMVVLAVSGAGYVLYDLL